jgi:hypothetical protein
MEAVCGLVKGPAAELYPPSPLLLLYNFFLFSHGIAERSYNVIVWERRKGERERGYIFKFRCRVETVDTLFFGCQKGTGRGGRNFTMGEGGVNTNMPQPSRSSFSRSPALS